MDAGVSVAVGVCSGAGPVGAGTRTEVLELMQWVLELVLSVHTCAVGARASDVGAVGAVASPVGAGAGTEGVDTCVVGARASAVGTGAGALAGVVGVEAGAEGAGASPACVLANGRGGYWSYCCGY